MNKTTMLIDWTYFDTPATRIAGLTARSGGNLSQNAVSLQNDIHGFIAAYEPRFLRSLLGSEVADDISNYPNVVDALVDEEAHTSVIAKYVWCKYQSLMQTRNTSAGEKVKQGDSSWSVGIANRVTLTWNDMCDECVDLLENLADVDEIHSDFAAEIFYKRNVFGI